MCIRVILIYEKNKLLLMSKKAASKWTIAFLAGFILTAGVILMIVLTIRPFTGELCPTAQAGEIKEVNIKVEGVQGKAGYESMYFEVKDCVEEIKYEDGKLKVKYSTADDPISYSTNVDWVNAGGGDLKLQGPGTYILRVYEDRVEAMVS